jgi:hypothetical protein
MASGFERLVARRSSPPPPAFIPGIGDAYKFVNPKARQRKRGMRRRRYGELPQNTPNLNRYPGFGGVNARN